jgi:uncharacterized protein YsxB (DUF464 family)
MIEVAFFKQEGDLIGFEASGHAGYDVYGRDIVCAAVSGILLTTLGGIQEVVGAHPKVRRNDENGYLQVQLPLHLEEVKKHDACLLIRSAENGLRSISEQYPDFVRIIIRNRR